MKVTQKDIPDISKFMGEFWELVKKYWTPEDNNQYWNEVFEAAHTLAAKYDSKFCSNMCVGFLDYLDCEWRKENGEE